MKKIDINKNFSEKLYEYASHPCFSFMLSSPLNPYQRPVNKKKLLEVDFSMPLKIEEVLSNKSKLIHQLLFTIYEQDMLFLDEQLNGRSGWEEFKQFYDPEFVARGKALKPILEYLAFDFIGHAIKIPVISDEHILSEYLLHTMSEYEKSENILCSTIEGARDPQWAAKLLLIQMAPDFLTEASPLARTVLGSFGKEQSEMMKVLIDEYGYGVHRTKHSTLFESALSSANLSSSIHTYYHQYLTTSFMLINYFHYLTSNKLNWFKYLGALYYTEASIPLFDQQLSRIFRKCFETVDTSYFDEHVHIDKFHCRMVLEKMIMPSVEQYGEKIIPDILFGFESVRWVLGSADNELIGVIKENECMATMNFHALNGQLEIAGE